MIFVSKFNKVKLWFKEKMKNKKFFITTIVFFSLLVAVVFGFTISLSGILGSAYDVDNLEKNIDKIKLGDTINYTANGYSDWKVLSIDKKNKTIDIISNGPTENLEIKRSDAASYSDIIQATANKYMDGKYAIGARSIKNDEKELASIEQLGYWLGNDYNNLEHSSGSSYFNDYYGSFSGDYLPVVTINVGDTSGLNVNDIYRYSLNNIDEWRILYINDASTISIVPRNSIWFSYDKDKVPDFGSFIESKIAEFKNENVLSVRSFSSSDVGILNYCSTIYTGKTEITERREEKKAGEPILIYDVYSLETVESCGSGDPYSYSVEYKASYTAGFVPIITLKYGEPVQKDTNTELKVGDYVKYSANAYNSWKVLNINKNENTVEVVSSTGVKESTLKGMEDYENYEKILQAEVDRYKNGDIAISARALGIDDVEYLSEIQVPVAYKNRYIFLNKKKKARYKYTDYISYSIAMIRSNGDYSMSASSNANYLPLLVTALEDVDSLSSLPPGDHSVTGDLIPVIKLKLSEVEKVTEGEQVKPNTNNKKPSGQGSSSNTTVSDENIDTEKKENVEEEKEDYSEIMNEFSKLYNVVGELKGDLKEEKSRSNLIIIFNTLIIGLIGFSFVYFARRR